MVVVVFKMLRGMRMGWRLWTLMTTKMSGEILGKALYRKILDARLVYVVLFADSYRPDKANYIKAFG